MKTEYFYLFAGVLLIIILTLFILRFFTPSSPMQNTTQPPTPTLILILSPTPIADQAASEKYNISTQDKQKINQSYFVSNLINNVPYKGRYFTLDYNFNTSIFLLTLDKNNLTVANMEFDAYLKTNSINNRSWFENLVTNYK